MHFLEDETDAGLLLTRILDLLNQHTLSLLSHKGKIHVENNDRGGATFVAEIHNSQE